MELFYILFSELSFLSKTMVLSKIISRTFCLEESIIMGIDVFFIVCSYRSCSSDKSKAQCPLLHCPAPDKVKNL